MTMTKIGAVLALDGEKEFKSAVSGINKDMAVLGSEMGKVTAQFGSNKNSIEALTAKSDVYNKQIVEQKNKVEVLTNALEASKKEYGENSDKVKEWQIKLNNAEGQLSKTENALKQTTEQAKKLDKEKFENFANGLKNIGKMAVVAGAALLAGFGVALISGAKDAALAEAKVAQLDAVLKSTGGAAGMTRDSLLSMAEGLEKTTKFSAEAALEAESLLLTFTNIGKDTFPAATQAAADMATAMGTDMAGQSIALGKALNDPVKGITALTRVGVSFTDQQKEQIKSMQESGDMAGAQAIILGELNKEFGGSALAAGATFAGQLEIVKNGFGAITESLALQFMPYLSEALTWIQDNLPAIQETFSKVFGVISDVLKTAFEWFKIYILPALVELFDWVQANMPQIQSVFGIVFGAISGIVSSLWHIFKDNLLPILHALWDFISPTFPLIKVVIKLAFDAVIGIVKLVIDIFDKVTGAIKTAVDWLTKWNGTQAKDKNATVNTVYSTKSQNARLGYATGTSYATPGTHWVGENGPELLNFKGGESVLNAKDSAKVESMVNGLSSVMGSQQGGNYTIQLVLSGKTLAEVLFDPLKNVAIQKGVPA